MDQKSRQMPSFLSFKLGVITPSYLYSAPTALFFK
jgi:hypothetical protein